MPKRTIEDGCRDECLIKQALSGLCVGLVLTDSDGRVTWANRAAERILGVPASKCLGRPLQGFLKDLRLAAFWQEAADADGNAVGDIAIRWPERLFLKLNATRCTDESGNEIGRALLFCDVTAEQSVQVELSQAVAERLLALTAGHMPPEPVARLTRQEVRILRLVGQSLSNDEIATQAHISSSTVRSHLKNVYRKLALRSRSEAVGYAVRNHLA